MKIPGNVLTMLLLIIFSACTKEGTGDRNTSQVILTKDAAAYVAVASDRSFRNSDPFDLKSISLKGDLVEISVAYSGGCKQHSFEVIWNGALAKTNPPEVDLFIRHLANGDGCEAYITGKFTFSLTSLLEGVSYPEVTLHVMNGGNAADSITSQGDETEIRFAESDTCNVFVTARTAICGYGLYGSLWFALDDSIPAGTGNYYFHKFLQPVAISSNIRGFVPVAGKRYKLGGRIDRGNYFPDIIVCDAYPGPSIPVKIMCIKAGN